MKTIIISALLLLAGSSAAYSASRGATKESCDTTFVLTVSPKMHCQNCVNKVKKNIRFEKGVKDIAVNLEKNQVTIKADKNKTNTQSLAKGFARIGYKINEVK